MDPDERSLLQRVAAYQFGAGVGPALFPGPESFTVHRSSSGRPRQVLAGGDRVATYRSTGRLTLGAAGGRRLQSAFEPPRHRVVVGEESDPYVRDGRNAFSKFVRGIDEAIRPGDEVLVVDGQDSLLAVGRAELPGAAMEDFETGVAVSVREGIPAEDGDEDGGVG